MKLFLGMGPSNETWPENANSVSIAKAGGDDFRSIPANSTIGGNKSLDVEITVGSLTGIAPNVDALHLRITELPDTEHGVTHEAVENHVDIDLPVDVHWQRWQEVNGPTPTSPHRWLYQGIMPPKTFNSSTITFTYTTSVPWSTVRELAGQDFGGTASRLLGHNGAHKVQIIGTRCHNTDPDSPDYGKAYFNDKALEWTNFYTIAAATGPLKIALPLGYATTVQNLTIENVSTSNGTSDYFKFDPDNDSDALAHPSISFTIADKKENNRYQWWLWVKPTRDEVNSVAFTGIMNDPGSQSVTINAASPQGYSQDHPLGEWGTYTFDLRVQEIKEDSDAGVGEPVVDLRSEKLEIPYNYADAEDNLQPGHSYEVRMDDATEDMMAIVSYYLKSERNALSGKVTFLDAAMQEKANISMQLQAKTPRGNVELYKFNGSEDISLTQEEAIDRAIFSAVDNFADQYRDHKPKPMGIVNAENVYKVFHIEDDRMISPDPNIGALNAFARSYELRKAFKLNGWWAVTADTYTKNKRVDPQYCDVVPFYAQLHTQDQSRFQAPYFHYKNSWRYVHVIAAAQESEGGSILGQSIPSERWSYIYTLLPGLLMKGTEPNIKKTTIHEVGHVLGVFGGTYGGHDHPDAQGERKIGF